MKVNNSFIILHFLIYKMVVQVTQIARNLVLWDAFFVTACFIQQVYMEKRNIIYKLRRQMLSVLRKSGAQSLKRCSTHNLRCCDFIGQRLQTDMEAIDYKSTVSN